MWYKKRLCKIKRWWPQCVFTYLSILRIFRQNCCVQSLPEGKFWVSDQPHSKLTTFSHTIWRVTNSSLLVMSLWWDLVSSSWQTQDKNEKKSKFGLIYRSCQYPSKLIPKLPPNSNMMTKNLLLKRKNVGTKKLLINT
jgi:hypothetical protein